MQHHCFSLKYHFTMLCWVLPYSSVNQQICSLQHLQSIFSKIFIQLTYFAAPVLSIVVAGRVFDVCCGLWVLY